MKHTFSTPALTILCTFWFLLGMVAWKYSEVIVRWVR